MRSASAERWIPGQKNLAPLYAVVKADDAGAPDGVGDAANMPP